jgi:hypothetical protein
MPLRRSPSGWMRWPLIGLAVAALASVTSAQRFVTSLGPEQSARHSKYDGKFALARLIYTTGPGGYYYQGLPAWKHGYPTAELNLTQILNAITAVHPHLDDPVALAVDDPELTKYPIAFMTEAGYWVMNDEEAAAFRAYFQKGGFVIFDDFRPPPRGGGGWENFEANMQRVLPGVKFYDLDESAPIFHCFFDIESFSIIPQWYDFGRPVLRGIYQDNDPSKRLMAIINFNTDVSNFWEFSGTGLSPVSDTNQAYELGVNYIIYGLTH